MMRNYTTFLTTVIVLLIIPLTINAQVQIGDDIIGTVSGEKYGEQVKMSSNGNIVAVLGSDNASDSSVHVFKNNGGEWVLYGIDSEGGNFGSVSATSISLSYDGATIAIGGNGLARVFSYESGIWTQKGLDIENSTSNSSFGYKISISSDGSTVAVSTPQYNPGFSPITIPPPIYHGLVQIFKYESGNWNQIGDDIEGESMDTLGEEISMSADGKIIAISSGMSLKVYENISDVWILKGNEIIDADSNPARISLSDDGTTIAIGDPDYSDEITTRGRTKIYKLELDEWIQIGNDILGDESFSRSGRSLSISPDGQVLVIGAVGNISGVPSPGLVRVYKFQESSWVQIGVDILGDEVGDHFGDSVSLSSDANTLAIGAQYSDVNGFESGYVRVYELNALLSKEQSKLSKIKLYPNPAKNHFTIQLPQGLDLDRITIYSNLGEIIKSNDNNIVNTVELSSGVYYVEITTNYGTETKKLIKF